jgi:hypothetical protein
MSRQSKKFPQNLQRGKVTHEPGSLSGADSAGREGRAYVIRVDDRARVTNAAATLALRAHDFTFKKAVCCSIVPGARQDPSTIADNAKALGLLLARLEGSRDALGSAGREGRTYVMRADARAKVTYAAATPAVLKVPGARQHPAAIAYNAKALG